MNLNKILWFIHLLKNNWENVFEIAVSLHIVPFNGTYLLRACAATPNWILQQKGTTQSLILLHCYITFVAISAF